MAMEYAQDPQEIERRIADVSRLTEWSPVPSGDVVRVPAYAYPAWGIVLTPDNCEWLYTAANAAYAVEWKDTGPASNHLVAQASVNAGLSDVNAVMDDLIGLYAASHLLQVTAKRRSFTFPDVGAGTGATTLSVLRSMLEQRAHLDQDSRIILIEPSMKRLAIAEQEARSLAERSGRGIPSMIPVRDTDVNSLSKMDENSADLVVQNASIHHNSFNRHLREISRVLKPGTPFISGDWHNSMWERPARVYWLLYALQNLGNARIECDVLEFAACGSGVRIQLERPELREFREYFSLGKEAVFSAFDGLLPKERQANAGIMQFWLEVGKLFAEKQERAPIFFLESHERVSKRTENLLNAGFVFDRECRQKYKEVLVDKGRGELAAVMVAKKRC